MGGCLLIGPVNEFDSVAYCEPEIDYGHCNSGGRYDWDVIDRWDLSPDDVK